MATDNDLAAVELRLFGRLDTNLGTLPDTFTTDHIDYPNAPFNTPQNRPWMRLSLVNAGVVDADASGSYEVNQGIYTVQVFYPRGTGSQMALNVGKAIKSLYTATIIDDTVINSVSVTPSPEPQDSPWYGVNVIINFQYEGLTS